MADPAPSTPHPPRFRWLKRLGGATLVLLLAVLAMRLYWGHAWQARLDAEVAAIAARGEPIHFHDVDRPPVPDHLNAAAYLRQSLATWPRVDGELVGSRDREDFNGAPLPDPVADSAAYLADAAAAIDLVRQAAAAPEVDWRVQIVNPPIQMHFPHFGELRRLAYQLDDAAERAHALGDDALAVELITLMATVADSADAPPHTLLGRLVRISIDAMMIDRIEKTLPGLRLGDAEGAATGVALQQLADALLDERSFAESHRRAILGERWFTHHTVMALVNGQLPLSSLSFSANPTATDRLLPLLFRPVLVRDAVYLLQWSDARLAASTATNLHDARTLLDAHAPDPARLEDEPALLHPISAILLPSLDAATRTSFQVLTRSRLAAAAIAIKRYERDHGRRPDALADLVPDYLPAVPRDPLASGDQPVRYLPGGVTPTVEPGYDPYGGIGPYHYPPLPEDDGEAAAEAQAPPAPSPDTSPRAVLYSVGVDDRDDGGRFVIDDTGKVLDNERYRDGRDLWFLLDPPPEVLPPSTGPNTP